MSGQVYQYLGNDLHDLANVAKEYFAKTYGAKKFICEMPLESGLELRPTWQAQMQGHYLLCVEVCVVLQARKFSDLVTKCVTGGHPIRLWVVVPNSSSVLQRELKEAADKGIGLAQADEAGTSLFEFSKPVALSLFGLRPPDYTRIPTGRREIIKRAEDAFRDGSPERGCQELGQELELLTRKFAEHSHAQGWWKTVPQPVPKFAKANWVPLLDTLNDCINQGAVQAKCAIFKKAHVGGASSRALFRNQVSHAPKNTKELKRRDERLRTEFEATLDLLLDWYEIMKMLKLLNKF
jgi:hypothetical protein